VSQRKLQRRQQSVTPAARQAERSELAERAVAVSRGNPGLQDLIGLRLVYGEQVSADRAEAAVACMEAYLRRGDLPAEPEVRAFLEILALDALLDEAGPSNVALLRAATLFDLPVPEPVTGALAREVGGSVPRLRGLGLLDPYVDLYDPARTALAVNPLAAGRVQPLSDDERPALAAVSVNPLFTTWGGAAGSAQRSGVLDLQLTRLALLADDPAPVAACAADAVGALRSGPAADAFRLGQDAIGLLDRHSHPVPLFLLRQTAGAALTSGDGDAGEALLARAARQAEGGAAQGIGPLDQARVIFEQGRRLIIRGDLENAEQLLKQAKQIFATEGAEREAAVVMGSIADINYRRGNYDEALRIQQEIELPTYEQLGDTRSAAMTWGNIADINYERGDHDEAAELQAKRLQVNKQLGDLDGIATAEWGLAQIDLAREDYQAAFPRLTEAFQIFGRLQRPDGIAIVGSILGQFLMAGGASEDAREVFEQSLAAARKLGRGEMAREIEELIESLPAAGETGSALQRSTRSFG